MERGLVLLWDQVFDRQLHFCHEHGGIYLLISTQNYQIRNDPGLQHISWGPRLPGGDQTPFHGRFMGDIVIINGRVNEILCLCPMYLNDPHLHRSLCAVCLCCLIHMIQTTYSNLIYTGTIFDEIFPKQNTLKALNLSGCFEFIYR
jgi:hypothetical protein